MFKRFAMVLAVFCLAAPVFAQDAKPAAPADPKASPAVSEIQNTDLAKVSYGIGYNLGKSWKQRGLEVDLAGVAKGLADAMKGVDPLITEEEMIKVMNSYADSKMKEIKDKNTKEGDEYRTANKAKPGVVELPSGLQYKVVREGSGESPKETDTVSVHYRGKTLDGQEFDSSYQRNEPAVFPVNGVIPGWTEALKLMRPGAKWEVVIPPTLAYGDQGAGGVIGPAATLLFEVELLEIKKEAPAAPATPETPATPASPEPKK